MTKRSRSRRPYYNGGERGTANVAGNARLVSTLACLCFVTSPYQHVIKLLWCDCFKFRLFAQQINLTLGISIHPTKNTVGGRGEDRVKSASSICIVVIRECFYCRILLTHGFCPGGLLQRSYTADRGTALSRRMSGAFHIAHSRPGALLWIFGVLQPHVRVVVTGLNASRQSRTR